MLSDRSHSRMKYLNIVSAFPVITETFIYREIRIAQQMGCEVVIASLRGSQSTREAGDFSDLRSSLIRIKLFSIATLAGALRLVFQKPQVAWRQLRLVLSTFPDLGSLWKLAYIFLASLGLAARLRNSGISLIRANFLHSEAVASMFVSQWLEIPYNFTCHTVKTYYPDPVIREVIQSASLVLANILQVKQFLLSLGAAPLQVHLIRNGVSLQQFPMRLREPEVDLPVILAVGRFDYRKGFHVLISACGVLRDEGVRFRCVLAGDGDERSDLMERRKTLALEDRVEMPGSLGFTEVQRWYQCATLLAVPSVVSPDGSTDGLPTVIIEAFAQGVPVVGTSTAGIPEAIQNGVNGFTVAPGSARDLANRVKELLGDADLRRKFAREARQTAEREFDLDRNVKQLVELMFSGEQQTVPPPATPELEHATTGVR